MQRNLHLLSICFLQYPSRVLLAEFYEILLHEMLLFLHFSLKTFKTEFLYRATLSIIYHYLCTFRVNLILLGYTIRWPGISGTRTNARHHAWRRSNDTLMCDKLSAVRSPIGSFPSALIMKPRELPKTTFYAVCREIGSLVSSVIALNKISRPDRDAISTSFTWWAFLYN